MSAINPGTNAERRKRDSRPFCYHDTALQPAVTAFFVFDFKSRLFLKSPNRSGMPGLPDPTEIDVSSTSCLKTKEDPSFEA
jgi:hypothetical protein